MIDICVKANEMKIKLAGKTDDWCRLNTAIMPTWVPAHRMANRLNFFLESPGANSVDTFFCILLVQSIANHSHTSLISLGDFRGNDAVGSS
jgi:hypothetical protein